MKQFITLLIILLASINIIVATVVKLGPTFVEQVDLNDGRILDLRVLVRDNNGGTNDEANENEDDDDGPDENVEISEE